MSRGEIIHDLSVRLGIKEEDAAKIFAEFIDLFKHSLSQGREIRIPGFGKFIPSLRGGHIKTNANFCKEKPFIPKHVKVTFMQYDSLKMDLYNANKELWNLSK